jgi:hypothetical protein
MYAQENIARTGHAAQITISWRIVAADCCGAVQLEQHSLVQEERGEEFIVASPSNQVLFRSRLKLKIFHSLHHIESLDPCMKH